jgi:hypothetical protein
MRLHCPQGHSWEANSDGPDAVAACPDCGSPAETCTLQLGAKLSSEARARVERLVNRFEDDWQAGRAPSIDAYLLECPEQCDALLIELALVDLEVRIKRGDATCTEQYIQKFPRLEVIPGAVLALAVREFELRERLGARADVGEYCRRFPTLAPSLVKRLDRPPNKADVAGPGTVQETRALSGTASGPDTGPMVPGFDILDELGRGGMGVVYKAVQRATKRTVALKVMLQGPFASPRQQRRFEREVDLAASLRHPGIVTIYDSGVTPQGLHYFVMEYIEGVPLDEYLRSPVPSSQADSLRLFRKIASAVAYAHQRGVIHRDLKPGNIRLDADGEPHVLDFGLAKAAGSNDPDVPTDHPLTFTGEFLGTLAYASPEQAAGDLAQVDVRTDVYALGVILYQMLTGKFPYPVAGRIPEVLRNIAETEPEPPVSSNQERIDESLAAIMLKAMAKDPARRYQSAAAFVEDIDRYLAGEAPQARAVSMSFLVRSWVRRNFTATLGVVALGIVCGTVGSLPRLLARNHGLWLHCADAYTRFPDLPVPWEVQLVRTLPAWVLDWSTIFWLLGFGGLGFLTTLLVRPRSREEDVIAGMASGLVAGLAAFSLGGVGAMVLLSLFNDDLVRPETDLLIAGHQLAADDPLTAAHPTLAGLSVEQKADALRARVAVLTIARLRPTLLAVLVYALSLGGACGVAGVMTAGWLLRSGRSLGRALFLYACVAVPAMPLISSVLVSPAGVSDLLLNVERGLLTATIVVGLVRRWPARLLAPLYLAGLGTVVRYDDRPLPGMLIAVLAMIAAGAMAWQVVMLLRKQPERTT